MRLGRLNENAVDQRCGRKRNRMDPATGDRERSAFNGGQEMSDQYNWEPYTGASGKSRSPEKMHVGQIVVRNHVSKAYMIQLRRKMRAGMKSGMEFSTASDGDKFAIRRDK